MFHPGLFENARHDGIGVLELAGEDRPGAPRAFVPLRRTELVGEVAGPLAALRLTQVFGLDGAPDDRVLEALYRFPLPGDAAVTGVTVRFGEVGIRATLKERDRAEADYAEAKRQGRPAALATRETPDVFTLQVAGIRADQEITVATSYVQLARPEGPGWSLRLPLTTAPRYVRGDEAGTRPAAGQPLSLLRDPGHRFRLDLLARAAEAVTSASHALDVARAGDDRRVRLRDGEVVPDRDCVLAWRPAQPGDRPALRVLRHEDDASGRTYFLALVAPPAARDPGRVVPREAVLLVDRSGSMEGAKWQAADWAVERFLSGLSGRDAFALGLFHDTTRWLDRAPRPAEAEAVARAVAFLKAHRDRGGTELGVALEQALHLGRAEGRPARHVLIVTDAQVSDSGRILRLADEEARRPDRRRISLPCIDAAPNSHLALELAARGGGVARFLPSDPDEGDIATALDEVLADWAEPVLAGLRLEVDRPGAEAPGRAVAASGGGSSSIDLGDLPAGRALWVVGRVTGASGAGLSFRLVTAKGHEVATCRAEREQGGAPSALKALFGARRVLGLEHLIHAGQAGDELRDGLRRLGYDPDWVLADPSGGAAKVYAENARIDAQTALRDLMVREALDYGLASSETAFVAERTEAGRPVEARVVVANALPARWSEDFLLTSQSLAMSMPRFAPQSMPPRGASLRRMFRPQPRQSLHVETSPLPPPPPPPPPAAAGSRPDDLTDSGDLACDAKSRSPAPEPGRAEAKPTPLFAGVPSLADGAAVLFDSTLGSGALPDAATIDRLVVHFPDGAPDPGRLDPGLELLVFVDDPTTPRARVLLADLVRQRGQRPLNLRKRPGQAVRIVLVDPAGAWARGAPRIELALRW